MVRHVYVRVRRTHTRACRDPTPEEGTLGTSVHELGSLGKKISPRNIYRGDISPGPVIEEL